MSQHYTDINDHHLLSLLQEGAIGVIPTDTVYGLVARAADESAVQRLYSVKERPLQPGTIIAAMSADIIDRGFSPAEVHRAARFWPASVSVVMDASGVANYLKHVRTSLAVRIPDNPSLLNLLRQTGPLMTTSANVPKAPTSRTIDEAVAYFHDELDFYVDAGDLGKRPPSTIIGFDETDHIHTYRQGAVVISEE